MNPWRASLASLMFSPCMEAEQSTRKTSSAHWAGQLKRGVKERRRRVEPSSPPPFSTMS
jgi:hypothetical protein